MSLMHAPNPALSPDELDGLRYPLLASEKLDGFRLLVMGNTLLTKSFIPHANRNLAVHFAGLLALSRCGWAFDAEIWAPGMTLAEIQAVLQSRDAAIPEGMSAHVFDCLTITRWFSSNAPRFEHRLATAAAVLSEHRPAHAVLHSHRRVTSPAELSAFYAEVIHRGGEGLMLRDPAGTYHHGRCTRRQGLIYKLKPSRIAVAA